MMVMFNQIIHSSSAWFCQLVILLSFFIVSTLVAGGVAPELNSQQILSHSKNNIENLEENHGHSLRKPWLPSIRSPNAPALLTTPASIKRATNGFTNSGGSVRKPLKLSQDKKYHTRRGVDPGVKVGKSLQYQIVAGKEDEAEYAVGKERMEIGAYEDVQELLEQFINAKPDLTNNLDVITQAFRFVKLDSHLSTLVNQLAKLQESHENLQSLTVKQETKFEMLAEAMKNMANSLSSESTKLKFVEDKIESEISTMNQRLDSAVQNVIKSSATSHMMLELSKESLQQMDKIENTANKVLSELGSVKTELGDVGQVSIQAIYNVQKSEENLMTALVETANRTIYALRQEPQSLRTAVLLENGSEGNSVQADANGSTDSNSDRPKALSSLQTSTQSFGAGTAAQSLASCSSRKRLINGKPRDCNEVLLFANTGTGIYKIYPWDSDKALEVFCDLDTNGGGWTVIQRRGENQIHRENFYRTWQEYENSFGSPYNHFWIGLSGLASLTKYGDQELRVELTDWNGTTKSANYAYFRVANSSDLYRLHVTDFEGNAGDSLTYHNGMQFSTKDKDNDLDKNVNCAQRYHGAWWYKSCHLSPTCKIVYDWDIRDFDCICPPSPVGPRHSFEKLKSQPFIAGLEIGKKSKWHAEIEGRPNDGWLYSDIVLEEFQAGQFEKICCRYIFSLLLQDDNVLTKNSQYLVLNTLGQHAGSQAIISIRGLWENKQKCLVGNTLRCRIELEIIGDRVTVPKLITMIPTSSGIEFGSYQLEKDFTNLLHCTDSSDVIIECGDKVIHAHKLILCARSSVFKAMFDHSMKESISNRIVVEDFDPDIIEILIQYIYTAKLVDLTNSEVIAGVIQAADKYQLIELKNHCFQHFARCIIDEYVGCMCVLAYLLNADDYVKTVIENYCQTNWKTLLKNADFKKLVFKYPAAFFGDC